MNNKISIIIPFYNTKIEYLKASIESAINQTYDNIEIIVINDGSLSAYDVFLEQYKDKIKIIKTENNGVSSARNRGIEEATGDYVTFLDSDDFLELNACELFLKCITENSDTDIVISKVNVHGYDKTYENFVSNNVEHVVYNKQELIECIFLNGKYTCVDTPWAKLYRRSFLEENQILFNSELSNGEDGLFNFIAYYKASKIYFTNSKTYNYRTNPYSTCKTYSDDLNIRFSNILKAYKQLFEKENINSFDKILSLFALRVFCRLIRKYYSHCENYDDFKKKYNDKSNEIYDELLKNIKYSDCNNKRYLVLMLYKLKLDYFIYFISKSNINIM